MQSIGFTNKSDEEEYSQTKEKVMESLKKFFRPEFLNRLDDTIIFDVLSREVIRDIVDIQLNELRERLKEKNMKLEVTDQALEHLAKEGYDPQFGARPLRRVIQNQILNKLANALVKGDLKEGDTIIVGMEDSELVVSPKKSTTKGKGKRKSPARKKVAA